MRSVGFCQSGVGYMLGTAFMFPSRCRGVGLVVPAPRLPVGKTHYVGGKFNEKMTITDPADIVYGADALTYHSHNGYLRSPQE